MGIKIPLITYKTVTFFNKINSINIKETFTKAPYESKLDIKYRNFLSKSSLI